MTYGSLSYTYTANGDLQSKTDTSNGQVTNYTYDAMGNLRHVGLPDGRSIDYLIDSRNRRVGKKINGVVVKKWTYRDRLRPAAEFDGAGTLLARYLNGVTIKGSTSYRVVADHLGTPRLLVNSTTGAVVQRMDLDEWGQVIADTNAGFQAIGFGGGIYDPDTGLVRFGARDYDPVVGRWTSKDPIRFRGGDANLFGYVVGDPVNYSDPSGLKDPNGWHHENGSGWLTPDQPPDAVTCSNSNGCVVCTQYGKIVSSGGNCTPNPAPPSSCPSTGGDNGGSSPPGSPPYGTSPKDPQGGFGGPPPPPWVTGSWLDEDD